jgi:hypothetical protein
MKRSSIHKTLLKIVVFIFFPYSPVLLAYSGGDGSCSNPYEIANVADLQQFSTDSANWNKCFKHTSDINMAGIAWIPVSSFSGTFDGQEYTISNLTITLSTTTSVNVGFIGVLAFVGEVSNLTISNLDYSITGTKDIYVGGLVGVNNGEVEHCGTTGSTESAWSVEAISTCTGGLYSVVCGGLIGKNDETGEVKECFSDVNVLTEVAGDPVESLFYNCTSAGGLVGDNYYLIEDCFAIGNVDAYNGDAYAGGFVAWNNQTGIIRRCYSTGNAYSIGDFEYDGGGFAEENYEGVIQGCLYDVEKTGNPQGVVSDWNGDADVQDKTTLEMKTESTFLDKSWDFVEVWELSDSTSEFEGYPVLRVCSPLLPLQDLILSSHVPP